MVGSTLNPSISPGGANDHRRLRLGETIPGSESANRVLVLMATFNGAPWLDEQVASIVGQEGVRLSWHFADDGSTDGTPARLQHWAGVLPRARLLVAADRRLGAAGSFLRLLREATLDEVDFVALADQDDLWLPGRLLRAMAVLHGELASGYSSDVIAFWPNGQRRLLGKAFPQRSCDYLFEPAGPGCTYVLTVALARALQRALCTEPARFDGVGYHDWLIYAFARTNGFRWVIDPKPGVLYRQHAHNELGANLGLAAVRRRWARLRTGWFRQQVLHIAGLWPGDHGVLVERLARLGWRDRLSLAFAAAQCRRRPRDQLALATLFVLYLLQ